ncbi:MAG: glycoside hydrolase family 16 protein [Bacteriovoracaceae bacterium]
MKKLLYLFFLSTLLFSCKKDDLFENLKNSGPLAISGASCIADIRKSSYQNLVFVDDFIPDTDSCYTDQSKIVCSNRLDWFVSGNNCPADHDYSGLKDLNKCVWNVWTGWNFWSANTNTTYMANAVSVSDGHLKFKMKKNPNFDASKGQCGAKDPAKEWNDDYYNRNCKYAVGGVDSKYLDDQHKGRNALYGRIEMRAKLITNKNDGSYPALWMWPNNLNTGSPYVATTASTNLSVDGKGLKIIGEIDIMEHNSQNEGPYGFHSYHNWEGSRGHWWSTKGAFYNMGEYKVYGVEWSPTKIRHYIDNCVVQEINVGDKAKAGDRKSMYISDVASFLIMSLGTGPNLSSNDPNNEFQVDWVKIFE